MSWRVWLAGITGHLTISLMVDLSLWRQLLSAVGLFITIRLIAEDTYV